MKCHPRRVRNRGKGNVLIAEIGQVFRIEGPVDQDLASGYRTVDLITSKDVSRRV